MKLFYPKGGQVGYLVMYTLYEEMVGMIRQMEFVFFSFHFEERVILAQTFQSNRTCCVGLFDFASRKFFL